MMLLISFNSMSTLRAPEPIKVQGLHNVLMPAQIVVPPMKGGDTMDKLLMLLAFVALAAASVMIRSALLHWVFELLK